MPKKNPNPKRPLIKKPSIDDLIERLEDLESKYNTLRIRCDHNKSAHERTANDVYQYNKRLDNHITKGDAE